MNNTTKERVAFMAASLIELADMTESELQEVIEVVGMDAIRKLMGMDDLRSELRFENMAEEICNFTGWDPMLVIPWRTEEELSRIGLQIADLIEAVNPHDDDAAEILADVLCWGGIWEWIECNDREEPTCGSGG